MVRALKELVAAVRDGTGITSTLADGAAALEIAFAQHASGAAGAPVDLPVTDLSRTVAAL